MKENYTGLQQKETEVNAKKNEYEKKLELGKEDMILIDVDIFLVQELKILMDNLKSSMYQLYLAAEAETVTARNDLKLALKRVEDLQQAINGELDSELDSLARYGHHLNKPILKHL